MTNIVRIAAIVGLALSNAAVTHAVSVGTLDTFENGTTQGWFAGLFTNPPIPPHVVAGGGPFGDDDAHLVITATGDFGAGSRLTAINASQWAGDYLAEDVTAIEMDLKNLGASDLTIRLLLLSPGNAAITTFGAFLPAGAAWAHVVFPIDVGGLTAVGGTVAGALSGVTQLRIVHNPLPTFGTPPVVGALAVDNIRVVPEPGAILLLGSTVMLIAVVGGVYRRRGHRPRKTSPVS